ncbi:MAG: hypothetical protein ACR2OE_14995 [Thermomicrobiales bacterium]
MSKTPIEQLKHDYDEIGLPYQLVGNAVMAMTADGITINIPEDPDGVTMIFIKVDPNAITDIDITTRDAPKRGKR